MQAPHKGFRGRALAALLVGLVGSALFAQEAHIEKVYAGRGPTAVDAIQVTGDEIRVWTRSGPVAAEAAAATRAPAEQPAQPAAPRYVTSEDGTQVGRVTYLAGEDGVIRSVFERAEGGTATRIERPALASFSISNDGQTVVAVDQDIHRLRDGRLTIYDAAGQVLGAAEQPLIRSARIAADGSRVAVSTGADGVVVFDRRAQRLYSLPAAADYRLSADGGTVALILSGAVAAYREGTEVARVPTSGIARDAHLTANGDLLAIVDPKALHVYEVGARKSLFTHKAPAGSGEYRTVDIAPDGETVAAGKLEVLQKRTRSKTGKMEAGVEIFDRTGQLLLQEKLTPESWNRLSPDIRFLRSGRKAMVRSGNAVYLLETPRANR